MDFLWKDYIRTQLMLKVERYAKKPGEKFKKDIKNNNRNKANVLNFTNIRLFCS